MFKNTITPFLKDDYHVTIIILYQVKYLKYVRSQTSEGPASTKKPVIGENSLPSLHRKIIE